MTTSQLSQHVKVLRVGSYTSAAPPLLMEYAYYILLCYSMLAHLLDLSVSSLVGGMQLALAAFCIMRLGSQATVVYTPLRLAFAYVLSFVIVQMTFHGESLMGDHVKSSIQWMIVLISFQSLYLRRGFLHRCVLVFFSMALIGLPYLVVKGGGRVAVDSQAGIGFSNSNDFGEWFGFYCLYFTIVGLETKRTGVRVAMGLAALGCLFLVGLSVSRGALLGTALGITIALRRLLRRGFAPLLVFILLGGIMYTFGIFDQTIMHYTARGTEETGRLLVWPLAIERFLSSPLLGVGASNLATYVPRIGAYITPHNEFIHIALVSGVLPFAFYVALWIRAAQNAFSSDEGRADGPFRLPLLVYAFMSSVFGGGGLYQSWGILTLVVAMASSTSYGVRRLVVHRVEKTSAGLTLWTRR